LRSLSTVQCINIFIQLSKFMECKEIEILFNRSSKCVLIKRYTLINLKCVPFSNKCCSSSVKELSKFLRCVTDVRLSSLSTLSNNVIDFHEHCITFAYIRSMTVFSIKIHYIIRVAFSVVVSSFRIFLNAGRGLGNFAQPVP